MPAQFLEDVTRQILLFSGLYYEPHTSFILQKSVSASDTVGFGALSKTLLSRTALLYNKTLHQALFVPVSLQF